MYFDTSAQKCAKNAIFTQIYLTNIPDIETKTKKTIFVTGNMPTSLHNLENSVGRPSVIETSQPHIIECT